MNDWPMPERCWNRWFDPSAPGFPDVPEDDEPVTDEDLADLAATMRRI